MAKLRDKTPPGLPLGEEQGAGTEGGEERAASTTIPALDETTSHFPLQRGRGEAAAVRVAPEVGPEEFRFCGRNWRRGAGQLVGADEWAVMRAHPHFSHFDFQVKE